jgi:PEP-CTERM motif-containing protein
MRPALSRGKLLNVGIAPCFALLLGIANQAFGGESATATITTSQTSAPFNYTISLHNTGTTTIGSFWYAWNATGYNFLATHPLSVTAPAGWSANVTNLGSGFDGYGIEYIDNGALLAPGATLSTFQFTSNDTPAQIGGNSIWYTRPPVGTSYIYQGAPQAPGDPGFQFVASVSTVPEPATIVLAGFAGLGALIAWRRRGSLVKSA